MRLEMKQGAVKLAPNQTLRVIDGAGSTVCAIEGAVWITEEKEGRDIVLEPGACYRLQHEGVALVNALGGEAAVSLGRPARRKTPRGANLYGRLVEIFRAAPQKAAA